VKNELFKKLTRSVKQAGEIARGERTPSRRFAYPPSRVQAVRAKAALSQAQFARLLGVSVKTLHNWEQARRRPTGAAAALLRIVEQEPEAALRALHKKAASKEGLMARKPAESRRVSRGARRRERTGLSVLAELREEGMKAPGFREGYEARDALIRRGNGLRDLRDPR
jgi:putative transcriptional regulator